MTRESPAPAAPLGERLALLGIVFMVLAAFLTSRCDTGESKTTPTEVVVETPGIAPVEIDPGPTTAIVGRVQLELPSDEPSPANPSADSLADAELADLLDGLPGWMLEQPGPLGCRIRAWRGNELVGPEVGCDAEGAYRLAVEGADPGTVWVEILVPGHLRGLLEIELPEGGGGEVAAPTLALAPGHVVSGQAVDARGDPLAYVRVQALPRPTSDDAIPWRTETDDEGRFEFTTLPYGPVSLRGIKPGYALSVVEAVAPERRVLLVLDALIDLEGAVVAKPEQLARAVVRLEGSSVWPAVERPLDEGGAFVFEELPDGIYGVEVLVPAAKPGDQAYASVPLENVTPDLRVALALVPAFPVPVRVVDPDGEAIAGARVTLGYSQIGMLQKTAETGVDGRAKVGPVVPGPYFVRADADGFLPPEAVEVEVGPEGFVGEEQVIVLIRPAKLEGVVVDEDGRPVEGAEVVLDSEVEFSIGEGDSRRQLFAVAIGAESGSLGVTRGEVPDIPLFPEDESSASTGVMITDELGRFEIDSLLPGTHRIWARHGEHAASAVETFELRSGELRTGLRLELREGVALTGVIRTENGEPIRGAQVDLGDGLVLSSDERGVFDAGFRRGKQEVVVRAPGMIPKAVVVDLGDEAQDLEVTLEPAIARVEGRLVDGNGQPIVDVEVELVASDGLSPSQITWTDARGVYTFDGLTPGEVELVFRHAEYVPAAGEAEASVAEGLPADFVLETGWTIAALVRSAVAGEPIAGVHLSAQDSEATTDKQGRARLEHLLGGRATLVAEAAGWVGRELEVSDDGSGEVAVLIELSDGGTIEGTIDDDIGDAVAGARIEVRSSEGEVLGTAKSDGRGHWRVDGVPEGDVVVYAEPPMAQAAVLAPIEESSDVIRGEVTTALRLRFDRL